MNSVFEKFSLQGGKFLVNERLFIDKLNKIKVFIFDWDGVFTNGNKDAELQSEFNESDSVGLNLLRFSYYLKYQKHPVVSIISGEKNLSAFTLVKRECIHRHYFKIPHKILAFEHLCHSLQIKPEECCYVFDDILDLNVAQKCGLRFYVKKTSAVLFNEYVIKNDYADYVTFSTGGTNAVREITELIMGTYNNFEECLQHRIQFSETYQKYLALKKSIVTENFSLINNEIQLVEKV